MAYHSFNPYTQKEEATYSFISDIDLELKLKLAASVFFRRKESRIEERCKILLSVAEELRKNKLHHAAIITGEMGKPVSQAIAEIEKCAAVSEYYAVNGPGFLEDIQMKSGAKKSQVWFEPLGIIFAIMPWNFPYWQVFRFIAPNFIAGNPGLLKHASNVPQCALSMEKLFLRAGAAQGTFQNLFINYEQGSHIIRDDRVRGVTLTGSNFAGYRVAELAGKYGKKTVLELGGSDPYVVFADADLDRAAETGIMARFQNNGQSCIASKRFIVQEECFDVFLEKFTKLVNQMKIGDPMDPETMIGPLARKDLLLELEDQLQHIRDQGGKIITGGKRKDSDSLILEPTIITGLPHDAPVNREELFGPVIPIFSFQNEEDAISLANDTPFGLGASIWTKDISRATRVARAIETGTVAINGMVRSEPGLPFGGLKASGYGRELSESGLKEFVNVKTVSYFA